MKIYETELILLRSLKRFKQATIADLVNATGRSSDSIRGTLRNMEMKGLTEKVRRGVWRLSPEGLTLAEKSARVDL